VIASDAEVLDLDPDQWAWLSAAVVDGREARRWAYVLHDRGVVVSTVPSLDGVPCGSAVGDPLALAERVLATEPVTRAVVIDRGRLAPIVHAAAAHVRVDGALTDYREDVHDDYWHSDAVVTVPAPPANSWRTLRSVAEEVGTGAVTVVVVDASGEVKVSIRFEVVDRTVRRISSDPPEPADVVFSIGETALHAALRGDDIAGDIVRSWSQRRLVPDRRAT
jgi:hypothetical protein